MADILVSDTRLQVFDPSSEQVDSPAPQASLELSTSSSSTSCQKEFTENADRQFANVRVKFEAVNA